MFGIAEFFKRIQGAHASELVVRTAVQEAVREHTSVEIPLDAIKFEKNNIVTLKGVNQTARSVIFIKKTKVLSGINTRQSIRVITDIR